MEEEKVKKKKWSEQKEEINLSEGGREGNEIGEVKRE